MSASPVTYELQDMRKRRPWSWVIGNDGLLPDGQSPIPYHAITEINLLYVMGSEYDEPHYGCRIYTSDGRKLFLRADCDNPGQCGQYRAFLLALHAAVKVNAARIRYSAGMRSKLGYEIFWWSMVALIILMECLVVFAVSEGGKPLAGVFFCLVIGVGGYFFLWMMKGILAPRSYNPEAIAARFLPPVQ